MDGFVVELGNLRAPLRWSLVEGRRDLVGRPFGEETILRAAHAYEQAGGRYYPKLQSCVPFTPVTGKRHQLRVHMNALGLPLAGDQFYPTVRRGPDEMEDFAEPLRLLDYCLINGGGVCLIVTSAERARDLKHPPVYIHASASCGDFSYQYTVDDCFYDALQSISKDLFANSDIQRKDIDVAEIYENFTPVFSSTASRVTCCRGFGLSRVSRRCLSVIASQCSRHGLYRRIATKPVRQVDKRRDRQQIAGPFEQQ